MNTSFEQLIHTLRSPKLSAEEKLRMRTMLQQQMQEQPEQDSRGFWADVAWYMRRYSIPMVFATFILLVTGVLGIAELSDPGDVTYGIKVDVNEPIGDAVAVSDEDQISWDITKAERRQEEIELLATENGF